MLPSTRRAIALLPAVLLTACATVSIDSTRDEAQHRLPKPRDHSVEVFHDAIPGRPHELIGSVVARVNHSPKGDVYWPDDRILDRLKEEARQLGGDALSGLAPDHQAGGGACVAPWTVLTGSSTIWSASVIVWLDNELD